jgi:Family of unknown function (DUF6510)
MRAVEDLVLDGNAIAGDLAQLFVTEATASVAVCAHCGAAGPLGGGVLYRGAGSVLRCRSCGNVLLTIVSAPGRMYVELRGVRCLEIRVPDPRD